jgi:hypothetical protein
LTPCRRPLEAMSFSQWRPSSTIETSKRRYARSIGSFAAEASLRPLTATMASTLDATSDTRALGRIRTRMTYDEVAEACAICSASERCGARLRGSNVPVNPADGQVIERLFNPYALGRTPRKDGICREGQRLLGRQPPEVVADRECRLREDLATDDLLSPWVPHRRAEERGACVASPCLGIRLTD